MKTVRTDSAQDGFEGWFYPVEGSDRCIILLAGSVGNDAANRALAGWINRNGCCALGIGKWQDRTGYDGVSRWPLEYFERALDWMKEHGIRKFGLYGMSMGANMALLAASVYTDYTLTISISGIDFVTEGFEEGKKDGMTEWPTGVSAFTLHGKELPYHPFHLSPAAYDDLIRKSTRVHHEPRSVELYRHMEQWPVPEECFVPVERIGGRLLVLAAEDDSMWESAKYARRMQQRLETAPHRSDSSVVIYPYGTHILIPYSAGRKGPFDFGDPIARLFVSGRKNAAACRESRKKLDDLLSGEIRRWSEE